MKRLFILLLDSFGIGATEDANQFGDQGADTFGHIASACFTGKADGSDRIGPLHIPNLVRLGLNAIYQSCHGHLAPGLPQISPQALYGYAKELSYGKDTPSGHWEIAGVPACFSWDYFPKGFSPGLIEEFCRRADITGILGNCHASGTVIINEYGDKHLKSGQPIVYTSGDSVFQVAAHEEHFGLARLYAICTIARQLFDQSSYQLGRVIARPFLGQGNGHYYRTSNRRDYTMPPPSPTLLDKLVAANNQVIAIGKVADIYANRGISQTIRADGNMALFDRTLQAAQQIDQNSLIFTNFVDFDSKYGHRRDVVGYAKALEQFDARLPEFESLLQPGDIVIITADHGCDPTFPGSDHTREYIPILMFGPDIAPKNINKRQTFADIGQTIGQYFSLPPFSVGQSFL